jgi:hypothetical protein
MDYEQEYEEYSQQKMSPTRILLGKILGWIGRILVFGIIALVLWRVLFSGHIPAKMKTLIVNENTYATYLDEGNKLTMYTQPQEQVIMEGDSAGYFWVCRAVFIPEADQVQILVRYNNSTLTRLAEDFELDRTLERSEDILDVTLVITVDSDPTNDTTTDRQKVRIQPSGEPIRDTTMMYNYRLLVFDGVTFDPASTINLSIEFYLEGFVDYDAHPLGSLVIYEPQYGTEPYALTLRDKRAIKQYAKANKTSN